MEESRRAAGTFLELFEYVFDLGAALEESLVGLPHYFVLFLLGKNSVKSAFNRFRLGASAQCFLYPLQFAAVESYMFMNFFNGAFHDQPLATSLSQYVHKVTIYVHPMASRRSTPAPAIASPRRAAPAAPSRSSCFPASDSRGSSVAQQKVAGRDQYRSKFP